LQDRLSELSQAFFIIAGDDLMEMMSRPKYVDISEEAYFQFYTAEANAAKAFSDIGMNVIMDGLFLKGEKVGLKDYLEILHDCPVLFVHVTCPLDELRRREKERGDREIGQGESQLALLDPQDTYDITVDTSREDCADKIIELLDYPEKFTAFKTLREQSQNIIIEYIAGVPIKLKKPFDLSFINKYGTVFKVVKNWEGSGNLCFGVENGGKKYFIKFAYAPKEKFEHATPDDAVGFLKEAQQVYQDLAHENLIKFIKGEEAGGGYLNIFEWVDAECIGYPNPESRQKFLNLPAEAKLRAFDDILDFHAHAAYCGYAAIDFYADQIMYDFENGKTIICDIDFYQKSPYFGDKGLWGSSNFVSPEECVPYTRVDEISMVYTMGATAFCIFSDYDRTPGKWTLSSELYEVAKKAVSDDRNLRHQSIRQFIQEWQACL
jgi:hypothetical protein